MLSDRHRHILEVESGIDPEVIAARAYSTVTQADLIDLVEARLVPEELAKQSDALELPIWRPDGSLHTSLLRLNEPLGTMKYVFQKGVPNSLDVNPLCHRNIRDPQVPLLITEGQKKADSILSAARREGIEVAVIALNGCTGWMATSDLAPKEWKRNEGKSATLASPDWYDVVLGGRQIVLIPDSDYLTNDSVRKGWDGLAFYLSPTKTTRLSVVITPPKGLVKRGADDYLVEGNSLESLLSLATSPNYVPDQAFEGFPSLSFQETCDLGLEPPVWLVNGWIQANTVNILAGETATRKTWAVLDLALALMSAQPVFGNPELGVPEPCKLVFISKEMDAPMIGRRIHQMLASGNYPEDMRERGDWKIYTAKTMNMALDMFWPWFTREMSIYRPNLIVVDSLSAAWHGMNENDSNDIQTLYGRLGEVQEASGASWLIVHHYNKMTQANAGLALARIRGSGQIVGQADSTVVLARAKEQDKDTGDRIEVSHEKPRLSLPFDPFVIVGRDTDVDGIPGVELVFDRLVEEIKDASRDAKREASSTASHGIRELAVEIAWASKVFAVEGIQHGTLLDMVRMKWPAKMDTPSAPQMNKALDTLVADGTFLRIPGTRKNGVTYRPGPSCPIAPPALERV